MPSDALDNVAEVDYSQTPKFHMLRLSKRSRYGKLCVCMYTNQRQYGTYIHTSHDRHVCINRRIICLNICVWVATYQCTNPRSPNTTVHLLYMKNQEGNGVILVMSLRFAKSVGKLSRETPESLCRTFRRTLCHHRPSTETVQFPGHWTATPPEISTIEHFLCIDS